MSDEKLHYFCFSYAGQEADSKQQCHACTYTGYDDKIITRAMIEQNKEYAGVTQNSVLLSVSYLGYMTKAEFSGE